MKIAAIIAAGGVGTRLKTRLHKPFVQLYRRPMLAWTLQQFEKSKKVEGIVVVTHPNDLQTAKRLARRFSYQKVIAVVPGGRSRMESVWRGLQALPSDVRWVAVHDAARPCVTPALIDATVKAAQRTGAAIAAVPIVPTIKEVKKGRVVKTLDRSRLWAVQTPQVFERKLLEQAHRIGQKKKISATDDASLVEAMGYSVCVVMGAARNLKITTQEDLIIAEAFIKKGRF